MRAPFGTWRGHRKRFKESGSVKKRGRGPAHRLYDGCRCSLSAFGASCPLPQSRRRSLDRTDTRRSAMVAGTGLYAPQRPLSFGSASRSSCPLGKTGAWMSATRSLLVRRLYMRSVRTTSARPIRSLWITLARGGYRPTIINLVFACRGGIVNYVLRSF